MVRTFTILRYRPLLNFFSEKSHVTIGISFSLCPWRGGKYHPLCQVGVEGGTTKYDYTPKSHPLISGLYPSADPVKSIKSIADLNIAVTS